MELTDEQVFETYGNAELTFDEYYKYSFSYKGKAEDGAEIYASYGGCADDIYRHTVKNNDKQLLGFPPESWRYVTITKDGEEIYEYIE